MLEFHYFMVYNLLILLQAQGTHLVIVSPNFSVFLVRISLNEG